MTTIQKSIVFGFLAGILVLFILVICKENGLLDLREKKKELAGIEAINRNIKAENASLYRIIDRLKNDSAYIESVARHELGMIADDEYMIKFHD